MKPSGKSNLTKSKAKSSKTNLNKSTSNNVSNTSKTKYNMRSNPRPSLLNKSLSSIPKPQPNTKLNNLGMNHCQSSSQPVPTRKNYSSLLRASPATRTTSAASPSLPVSRPSPNFGTLKSGKSTSSVSSVPSISRLVSDSPTTSSSNLTHDVDNQSSASTQDVSEKYSISQLLCERNALIDKIKELTTQLEHGNAVQRAASSPPCISLPTKVAIFSDSMCRGVAQLMSAELTNTHVTSDVKPGAVFSQVIESIASQCNDFGPKDYIFIQAGTNDIHSLPPNSAKRLQLPASLISLSNQTNIVFCSIPYRYDTCAHLSTNIYETNNFLKYVCSKFDFYYLDTNNFMSRPLYTKEGLHYNRKGKTVLVSHFVNLIHVRESGIRKFVALTAGNNVRTIVSGASNVRTIAPTRTQVCDVVTQARARDTDIDLDSTFGSLLGVDDIAHDNLIDLSRISTLDDHPDSGTYPIPVLSNVFSHVKNSNFNSGDQTPTT
ncbi:hypothetical protein M8J76_009553 [Diaphorina citri]|nr:hypothetical protein M8J77_002160 [Diaphorina citri]KAI5733248.1 hypothetical protein M8J76_009553 [Diaphorina citri]